MTILILGPSQWLPSKLSPSLEVLRSHLPASWAPTRGRAAAPVDVQLALTEILSQRGVPAIVMEAEEPKDPPNSTVKFHELVQKHLVGLERKGVVRREVGLGGPGGSCTRVRLV